MGIKLMVEILDYAPAMLTSTERLLLVALAEKADDASRRVIWPKGADPHAILSRRVGVTTSGVSKAFQRLAARGLEVRVQVATVKQGLPVYAFEGRAREFRIPELDTDLLGQPVERVDERATSQGQEGGPRGKLVSLRGWTSGQP